MHTHTYIYTHTYTHTHTHTHVHAHTHTHTHTHTNTHTHTSSTSSASSIAEIAVGNSVAGGSRQPSTCLLPVCVFCRCLHRVCVCVRVSGRVDFEIHPVGLLLNVYTSAFSLRIHLDIFLRIHILPVIHIHTCIQFLHAIVYTAYKSPDIYSYTYPLLSHMHPVRIHHVYTCTHISS